MPIDICQRPRRVTQDGLPTLGIRRFLAGYVLSTGTFRQARGNSYIECKPNFTWNASAEYVPWLSMRAEERCPPSLHFSWQRNGTVVKTSESERIASE